MVVVTGALAGFVAGFAVLVHPERATLVHYTYAALIAALACSVTMLFVVAAERRRAEQELAAHRDKLESLVEARTRELVEAQRQMMHNEKLASVGQLAAGIAHEINTPIQYVGDNLHALSEFVRDMTELIEAYRRSLEEARKDMTISTSTLDTISEAEKQRDLQYILSDAPQAISQGLEGVQRVAHIVRAMKDFSHVDREEMATVDINRAVENTLTVARNEYKYVADVVMQLGDVPPVECFLSEINQVLLNLIVNAAHAIADTKQRGTITVQTRLHDAETLEIAISDTGGGIPEEIRTRIYDPFFTTKEVGKGTGQGLNIAHRVIVEHHGGSLSFDTKMGCGTTFYIRLPLHRPSPPAPGEKPHEG